MHDDESEAATDEEDEDEECEECEEMEEEVITWGSTTMKQSPPQQ